MENDIYLTDLVRSKETKDRDDLLVSKSQSAEYTKFAKLGKAKQNCSYQIMSEEYYASKKVKPGFLFYKVFLYLKKTII